MKTERREETKPVTEIKYYLHVSKQDYEEMKKILPGSGELDGPWAVRILASNGLSSVFAILLVESEEVWGKQPSQIVWCVTRFANQSFRMVGVFTSEEKAREHIKKAALKQHADSIEKGYATSGEKQMKEETVVDRYWQNMQLDIEEMKINGDVE